MNELQNTYQKMIEMLSDQLDGIMSLMQENLLITIVIIFIMLFLLKELVTSYLLGKGVSRKLAEDWWGVAIAAPFVVYLASHILLYNRIKDFFFKK